MRPPAPRVLVLETSTASDWGVLDVMERGCLAALSPGLAVFPVDPAGEEKKR